MQQSVSRAVSRAALLAGVAALPLFVMAPAALAQGAPAAGSDVEEVIVTGSRIARDGFKAPTPVTVTTAQQLVEAKPLVSEALNDLPAVQVGSQRTGGAGSGGQGFATVSLRNLGPGRTLVLLDGRRVTPTAGNGTVDTSLIPNNLLSRVELVTGGASAAYGADAVAGVVNYILNSEFEGLKFSVEAGISERGDVPEHQASLAYGRSFADGRGHFLFGVEGYKSDGLRQLERDFFLEGQNILTNPCVTSRPATANCPTTGGPARFRATNVRLVSGNLGGLITSGPLRGLTFEDDGVVRPFQYGTYVGSRLQLGGEGDASPGGDGGPRTTAVGWLERANTFARFSYDVNDRADVFFENLLGWNVNDNTAGWPYALGSTQFRVQRDNAFLPESVRQQMVARNLSSITVGKQLAQWPSYITHTRVFTWRAVAGANYRLNDNWKLETYAQHGWNRRSLILPGMYDQLAGWNAVDAVRVPTTGAPAGLTPGSIVCRSTLTNPTDGCVPLNIFGPNAASLEAIRTTSALRHPWNLTRYTQDVVSAAISGEAFNLPAGPLAVAAGVEGRWEKLTYESDAYSQISNPVTRSFGGFRTGNSLPFDGDLNVKEYFAEAIAPVMRDQTLVQNLELNVAGRITDYSTSGVVKTWKVGALYNPISDLRFRVTRSRDIRAPTMQNLFAAGSSGTANLVDPFRQNADTPGVKTVTEGNPTLRPEIADTLVYGLVYQPSWFPGFSLSVDRWDIEIRDSIATIGNQTILDQCFRNPQSDVCPFIVRDANGVLTAINNRPFNFASAATDGVDVEMSLRRDVPAWMPLIGDGAYDVRLLATRTFENSTQTPGEAVDENVGEEGTPRWQALAQLTVTKGPWRGFLQAKYIDEMVFDNAWVEGVDIDDNTVGSVVYFDTRISREFEVNGTRATAAFAINNLFDRQPPSHVAGGDYDVVGRYFRVSLDFRY